MQAKDQAHGSKAVTHVGVLMNPRQPEHSDLPTLKNVNFNKSPFLPA